MDSLLSLRARASLMASEPWFDQLSKGHGGRVPRQMLDGPLAVWLLGGALTLAIHGSAGAVAVHTLINIQSCTPCLAMFFCAVLSSSVTLRTTSTVFDLCDPMCTVVGCTL